MQLIWDTKHKAATFAKSIRKQLHSRMYGNCAVLLYHRVCNYTSDPQLLCVTPENFESHIRFLKQNYTVLDIEEWKNNILNHKKFKPNSVVITFDDGYEDNFSQALPILEKYKVQVLFYICTGNINTDKEFWWDELERLLLFDPVNKTSLKIEIKGIKREVGLNKSERETLYSDLLPVLRSMRPEDRNAILKDLILQTGNSSTRATHRSMTWEEVKKMSASGSTVIGAHTLNHPSLAVLSVKEQQEEIGESKRILEEKIGKPVEHFSYPFGTKLDYTDDTIRLCRELQFKIVSANYPYIAHSHSDPFQVPRFLVRDWDLPRFKSELNSFFK